MNLSPDLSASDSSEEGSFCKTSGWTRYFRLAQVETLLEAFATRSDSIHESTAELNS